MTDVATPVEAKSPTMKKSSLKTKKTASHPTYKEMITKAITDLKERNGSSRQAILKYIMANFNVGTDATKINVHLKSALKSGTQIGLLKQSKGSGAAGSFRVEKQAAVPKKAENAAKKSPKKAKKPVAAKKPTAAKKPATAKKPAPAKKAPKKTDTKKPAAKKAVIKKSVAKKPTVKKPASKKTPKKAAKK